MTKRTDIELAALVHADQINEGEARAAALRAQLQSVRDLRAGTDAELDKMETEIAALRESLRLDDIAPPSEAEVTARFEPDDAERASIEASLPKYERLREVPLGNEDAFREQLLRYANEEGIAYDDDPVRLLVSEERVHAVRAEWEHEFARLPWDRWDYCIVGCAAVFGAVLDFVLVSVPQNSLWKGEPATGSPLTRMLREWSKEATEGDGWPRRMHRALEDFAKVSYDISINSTAAGRKIPGLRPTMHRVMSPGHDVLLGRVFGVLEDMLGVCTLIDRNGAVHVLANGPGTPLPIALIKHAAHLLSDLPTKSGLPPPFFVALQLLSDVKTVAIGPSGERVSAADLSRWMYGQGYDARHFATMSLVPLVIESVIRVGFWARNRELFRAGADAPRNAALKRAEMLAVAHAASASANAMKVAFLQGNPLAINQSVWMALAGSTVRWLHEQRAHDEAVNEELVRGWEAILRA